MANATRYSIYMQSSGVAPITRPQRSDWIGFGFFASWTTINAALAAGLFRRAPVVALLLAPTFAHELLIAVAFLCRKSLKREAPGWVPRAAAYAASFLMPVFAFAATHGRPGWMKPSSSPIFITGIALWMVGAYFGVWSLFSLRHAFSIVPQARVLVTRGPYRLARHPVYASYLLEYSGMTLAYFTPASLLVFALWWAVMMVRIRHEESVLSTEFSGYADYKRQVGRFMPRLRPQTDSAAAQVERVSSAKNVA